MMKLQFWCLILLVFMEWLALKPALAQTSQNRPCDYTVAMSVPGLTKAQADSIEAYFQEAQQLVHSGSPLQSVRQAYWAKVRNILNTRQLGSLDGRASAATARPGTANATSDLRPPTQSFDRQRFQVITNVPYTTPPDRVHVGDVYLPTDNSGARPAVLFIHGGGWVGGSKEQSSGIAQALARHGFVVFNINYRLVGQGGEFPGNVADVREALAFLASKSTEWLVDTKRIAAMGGSAGGHLSMMLGYSNVGATSENSGSVKSPRLAAVVSWFGVGRLSPGSSLVDRYIRSRSESAYNAASPITYASTAVPTLFVHGTADTLVPISQSEAMTNALRSKNIVCTLLSIEGAQHGFNSRDWSTAVSATIKFLDEQFALASGK